MKVWDAVGKAWNRVSSKELREADEKRKAAIRRRVDAMAYSGTWEVDTLARLRKAEQESESTPAEKRNRRKEDKKT